MDPDAAALLDALHICDHRGLYDRFSSFVHPFGDFIPLHSHNPNPLATKKRTTTAAPKKRGPPKKKKNPEPDPTALRPLAKQFLPFLCRALKLLPSLIRKSPKSSDADMDDRLPTELLAVYRLLLDCLACIGPCLAGKPYSVHLQRGRLVVCLEAWGRYGEAEEEALALLESLRLILVESAAVPKSRKGKIASAGCFLPDPALVSADDPEVTTLVIEVITILTGCAYKSKIRKEVAYDRILALIDEVQPWLRFLDPEALKKYQSLLVNTLYKCSLFLVEEYTHFEGELVQRFCLRMLRECLNSRSIDHFPSIVRKMTTTINLQWTGGNSLLLDILRLILESILCSCKVNLLKAVNEFLEIVSYFSSSICVANMDICRSAIKLLYEKGDDVLQVSHAVASILTLYATGLHFKFSSIQAKQSVNDLHSYNDAHTIMLFHDSGVDLQKMSVSLDTLASSFHISCNVNEMIFSSEKNDSRVVLSAASKSGKSNACMQTHGKASLISYIDALEFLCKPIVECVSTAWKNLASKQEPVLHSDALNYVQKGLHQLCDLILADSRYSDISERVEQRLSESQGTLLQVALATFRISLLTGGSYQKSLLVINSVISSTRTEPQELKFLISAISNIGAVCYNSGWLEKASKALQLCIEIIWAYVKLICGMYSSKSKRVHGDNTTEDGYKDAINDALSRIIMIIDFLYKCGAKNIKEIIVKSLYELSAAEDIFHDLTGLLTLMKQWVKIMCKEFSHVDVVDDAPVLYSLLLECRLTWSMNTISKILEQELIAYELLESQNPNLCQKMELRVVDFLLNDVYTSKNYNMQRSRVLVRKGRAFRAHGTEGLNKCLECLSEAISLLGCISGDPSQDTDSVSHQLALTYILYAQCAQEANQDCDVILHNVCCALYLWSGMNIPGHCSKNDHHEWETVNILPLLFSIVDLLSLKGCLKFQIEIFQVIMRFCMLQNVLLDKCISMLWTNRRLNHSLCSSPIDELFVLNISEQFGLNVNSLDYWISCTKDHPPSLCMLLQKLLPSDCIFSEQTGDSLKRPFASQITIEEVKELASSLITEVPLTSQSAFIAAYLYHDLSERLFSNGRNFEALLFAREALCLRNKILRRKFIYAIAKQSANSKLDDVTQSSNDHICLEAVSNAVADIWPDVSKSGNLDDFILSPWSVLRCYLESTLQVGIVHESTGNGAEAEYLFRIGKKISCLQGFPVLAIAFTTQLGQLYRRKQMWELAESEFKYAKKLLVQYNDIISCQHCKMAFEVTIDMQLGDLSRNLFGKGLQINSIGSLSHALSLYRSALGKLELAEMESCINICQKPEVNDTLLSSDSTGEAGNGVQQTRKFCLPMKEERSSVCSICLSLSRHKNIIHSGLVPEEPDERSLLNIASRKSHDMQVKKISKKSLRCSAKDLNYQSKVRRNRSSNQVTIAVNAVSVEVDSKSNGSMNHELCLETLSSGEVPKEHAGTYVADRGGQEECGYNKMECWRCLILQVMENGFMQNIIHLKWECHRRHLVLMLLLKIAKCLGNHRGKNGEHEVHEVFGQCISVMFSRKSLKYCGIPDSSLIELIVDEGLGDFFRIERAALLYNMSWFSLKNIISEHPRITCCSLSKIQMQTVFPWLLRAFILCQESPWLFQKVSRLLSSIFLLSTLDCSISLPVQTEKSLSSNHWAAYFHQASIGTYLHCQYYSRNKTCTTKVLKGFSNASMTENTAEVSKFLRFAPEKLEDLEECIIDFFKNLPSIPIICISMLGGDYANLIGEMLLLPYFFPAWILLSRLVANNQPIVILLPVDIIQEEIQLEGGIYSQKSSDADTGSVKHWHCPWGYSVVDCVLPSFKQLLEENFLLLTNATFDPADIHVKNASWWSQRTMLNNCLNKLLKSVENSWLGPWGCLLLGERSVPESTDKMVHKLISALKSQGKFETNYNLINAIISGAKSVADAESCIYQLLLYKGYFGRGACCGEERFRAFSAAPHTGLATEFTHDLIKEALAEYAEQVDRGPVIIVLDSDVQMLPWENLPILRSQEVYRMPSVGSIFLTLDKSCSHHKKDKAFGTTIPAVDPFNAYYLLNPSGDLNDTQVEFEQWFRNQEWEGKAGNIPTAKELILALQNRDLFLYFGHGSGTQYIPEKDIQRLDHCAATLLMGCSSGSLVHKGCYAPQGAPLSYLFAGSPSVIANLWDVTDKDIDRFGKALLKSWLHEELAPFDNCTRDGQLVKQFSCMNIKREVTSTSVKTRRKVYNENLHNLSDSSNQSCRRNRIVSFMSQARESCKLPMLIGASPVCYGVPTVIWKKSQS